MESILNDYEHKAENRYDLDMAIDHIHSIAKRIPDMNYQQSLGLIIGLITEECLPNVLSLTLESTLFKFRYFFCIDQQSIILEDLDQIEL